MDALAWLIFIILLYIALALTKAVRALNSIKTNSDITIKCLDAHETIIKKSDAEIEQQGAAIEQIKDLLLERN
ncbi:hypothetical protein [Atlantibacter hermannii]|uniref:hypothetical protein n=1 Tax=Atlantibacter hermannii TaxID=565 RepID=UPI00254D0190|nr:hypothetical protein [Atlantibacter hermannii]